MTGIDGTNPGAITPPFKGACRLFSPEPKRGHVDKVKVLLMVGQMRQGLCFVEGVILCQDSCGS